MIARIYRPRRGATQSGTARTKAWLLEIERTEPLEIDPLMGWTGSTETEMQVKVSFDTREEAMAYAENRQGLAYDGRRAEAAGRAKCSVLRRQLQDRRASINGRIRIRATLRARLGGAGPRCDRLRSSAG